MKLTTAQVLTIDEYLQRSGVTYWDIRVELLDHFIESIEEKMENDPLVSFDEALMEVTVAFGNDIQERHLLNNDRNEVVFSGIFSNNKGFKELEDEKRKQNHKKYLKLLSNQIKQNFTSIQFYVDYLCFALMVYIAFQYFTNWIFFIVGTWLTVEVFKTLIVFGKHKKFTRDSLRGEISSKVINVVYAIILNMSIFTISAFQGKYLYWIMFTILFSYPVLKASFGIHKKLYHQYKEYKELISA